MSHGNSIFYKNQIDMDNLPKHIAIIMDGNGRWAKNRFKPRNLGHQEGMKRVVDIVEVSRKLGIEYLTLYAFSTENWKRPKTEIDGLMKILVLYIRNELDRLIRNKVCIHILGDITPFPSIAKDEIIRAMEESKNNDRMHLNIALNYGGRADMVKAIKDILKDAELGNISVEDIDDRLVSQYLYTKGQPDPDLLIRPSGEMRISNFLLYQIAYTELWFSDILWPDFKEENLYEAIVDYQNRNRRFGGI